MTQGCRAPDLINPCSLNMTLERCCTGTSLQDKNASSADETAASICENHRQTKRPCIVDMLAMMGASSNTLRCQYGQQQSTSRSISNRAENQK